MAGKAGSSSAWDNDVAKEFAEKCIEAYNSITVAYNEISGILQNLTGAASPLMEGTTQKDNVVEAIGGLDGTFQILNERLKSASDQIKAFVEAMAINVDKNLTAVSTAGNDLMNRKEKAKETGK